MWSGEFTPRELAQLWSLSATSQRWQEGQHCAVALLLPAPAGDVRVLQPPEDKAPPSTNTRGKEPPGLQSPPKHPACTETPAGLQMGLLQVRVPSPITTESGSPFSACSPSEAAQSSPVMQRLHQCIICPLNKIWMLLHFQEGLGTKSTNPHQPECHKLNFPPAGHWWLQQPSNPLPFKSSGIALFPFLDCC